MSLYPCGSCGQKPPGKLATFFARWLTESGGGIGWKTKLCVGCATTLMASLKGPQYDESSMLAQCPKCGSDVSTGVDGTYLWAYPPGSEPKEYALTTCPSCAAELRATFQAIGTELGERGMGARAPTPTPPNGFAGVPW